MKYLVSLIVDTPAAAPIPWNSGAAYTGWIYRILGAADHAAHTVIGPLTHRSPFLRNFAVSPAQFAAGMAEAHGYRPETPFAALTFGTPDATVADAFVHQAAAVPLQLGDWTLRVSAVVPYPDPVWPADSESMAMSCFPLALRRPRGVHPNPVWPDQDDWDSVLTRNLCRKAQQFYDLTVDPQAVHITAPHGWRPRFQRPYGHPVAAFQPRAPLIIAAPPVIYDVIFTLGFGILNSAGLGVLTLDASAQCFDSDAALISAASS